jgi:hypothetical protein
VPDASTDSEPEEIEDTRLAVREDTLESLEQSDVEFEDTRLAVREDTLESLEESDGEFEDTRLAVREDTFESPEESEVGFEDALTPTESDAESVVSLLTPTEIESDGEPPELVSENSTDDDYASAEELEETPPEPTESEPESEDTLPDRPREPYEDYESEDTLPDRPGEPYENYESEDTLPDRPGEPYENYESEDTQNRGETYYDGEPYEDYEPEDTQNRGETYYDGEPYEDYEPEVFQREMPLDQTPGMDRTEPRQAQAPLIHLTLADKIRWLSEKRGIPISEIPGSENSIPSRVPAMDRMAFGRMAFAKQPVLQDAQTTRDQPPAKKQKTSHQYQRDRAMPSMPSQVEAFQRPRLGGRLHNAAPELPTPLATPEPREMPIDQTPGMDRTEPRQAQALMLHLSSENSIPSRVPAMDRMAFGRMAFAKQPVLQDAQTDQPPAKKQKTSHQYQRDREMPSMPSQVEAFQRPRLGGRLHNAAPELPAPLATPKPNDLWTPLKRQKLTDDQYVLKQG